MKSTGLAIGTLFTLFVVPAMYVFLAADHNREADRNLDAAEESAVRQT